MPETSCLVDKSGADASNADDSREQLFAALYDDSTRMRIGSPQRWVERQRCQELGLAPTWNA